MKWQRARRSSNVDDRRGQRMGARGIGGVGLGGVAVVLVISLLTGTNPMTLLGPDIKVGDAAPDFRVVDNGLQPVTLAHAYLEAVTGGP